MGAEEPVWVCIARRELIRRPKEVPGPDANPRILEYHATTSLHATSDEVAWCSAFVNWVMKEAGLKGTGSARARSWANWGEECEPKRGAVVVLSRGDNPAQGHVGLVMRHDPGCGQVLVLGGNQGNTVSVASFSLSRVVTYRWPTAKEGLTSDAT